MIIEEKPAIVTTTYAVEPISVGINEEKNENNNNGERRPYRRRFYGPKKVTNLTKSFSSFEDGFMDLLKNVPEAKAFCGETPMYQAVVSNILDTIRDNIPSLQSRRYPDRTISFSIDSHELGIRTDAGIAFGWRSYFDRDNGVVVYNFRVTYITLSTPRRIQINAMLESGWEKKESMIQSRFWDSVENKNRRAPQNNNTEKKETYDTGIGQVVAEATPEEVINEDIASQLKDYPREENPMADMDPSIAIQTSNNNETTDETPIMVVP